MLNSINRDDGAVVGVAVASIAAVLGAGVLVFTRRQRTNEQLQQVPSPPDQPTHFKVCVVGGGTIGSSFCGVFLAQGMDVVCVDPFLTRDTLEQRVKDVWPTLVDRGMTDAPQPPFDKLRYHKTLDDNDGKGASVLEGVEFVQECTFENVCSKQQVLADLDRRLDPSVIITSSTSFIPWQLLVQCCPRQTQHRILIGHPAIPHMLSFMEIYGTSPAWVHYCKQWYTAAKFDVIVMQKTVPGHVLNSLMMNTLQHAHNLVRQCVCTPGDMNTAMRYFGRGLYASHLYLSLFTHIGGDRGREGGIELSRKIMSEAMFLVLFSGLKQRHVPDFVANPVSRVLGRCLQSLMPPPPPEYMQASQSYEDIITDGGKIPLPTAQRQSSVEAYKRIPLEVGNGPFALPIRDNQ